MKEAITSLEEQVKVRVTSVENGRKFQNSKRGEATMPDGPAIFETSGAWEDFSTPSRDLRLLIAIDVVLGFPDRVARRPERYAMRSPRACAKRCLPSVDALEEWCCAARRALSRAHGACRSSSVLVCLCEDAHIQHRRIGLVSVHPMSLIDGGKHGHRATDHRSRLYRSLHDWLCRGNQTASGELARFCPGPGGAAALRS